MCAVTSQHGRWHFFSWCNRQLQWKIPTSSREVSRLMFGIIKRKSSWWQLGRISIQEFWPLTTQPGSASWYYSVIIIRTVSCNIIQRSACVLVGVLLSVTDTTIIRIQIAAHPMLNLYVVLKNHAQSRHICFTLWLFTRFTGMRRVRQLLKNHAFLPGMYLLIC